MSSNPSFLARVAAAPSLAGAARNAPIGRASSVGRPTLSSAELQALGEATADASAAVAGAEPLAHLQWGMRLIHATPEGSYSVQPGDKRVLVGILDTGVDGNHPDIAPNFNSRLSRNFTTDIPLIDGPCEEEPDKSCEDPAFVDENSHGTHFPPGNEHDRTVDNSCLDLPTEGNNVLSVNAIGPTTRKADYSNYGVEQSSVAAPGGFFRDDPWSLSMAPEERTAAGIPNLILAAYPENVAREFGEIEPDGTPNTPFVVRDCGGGTCAYYQYLQGTSMASPHAVGVAALIVSEYGRGFFGDISLNPATTQQILEGTATDHACPEPRLHSYADKGRPPSFDALCVGTPAFNGFYGHGIVDALRAVQNN